MKSTNFEFLREKWPELSSLAGFAEQYTCPDPTSALVKLRSFAEQLVLFLYDSLGLEKPPFQPNVFDLLTDHTFEEQIPGVICSKLQTLRLQGNKAAHGGTGT